MPDSFFASKSRKRKRPPSDGPGGRAKKPTRKPFADARKPPAAQARKAAKNRPRADEELDSDRTNDENDDYDLNVASGEEASGDEYEDETPAEKRLRLAKLYLESVKDDLGTCAPFTPLCSLSWAFFF